MSHLANGERIHLVDRKGRQYALTLKAGDTYHHSGETVAHDALIGKPDGSRVTLSRGKRMLALRPTFGDYVLKMPRGAQVLYPKDLALIPMWADVYPGARVFEAGTGSGALTMALLRAVGPRGAVVTYEARDDFSRTALANIERYMGAVPNLYPYRNNAYDGIDLPPDGLPFDRLVLDLPEPWRVVPHAVTVLRSGGIYLSFVPTVPQVVQTVEALERAAVFGMVQTFETLLRTWSIQGRSVRPDHRMVAHSGFITVARKVDVDWDGPAADAMINDTTAGDEASPLETEDRPDGSDTSVESRDRDA
ncbi:MAG TPA: tRNA (adenine-N1)-methyltransferase [Nitrospiraceae bacterium]|nr:tRNA (adenine-N1)-methyltransferase [Nitrospiraceae bacterium]